MLFNVSKTYQTITEESAQNGESFHGFKFFQEKFTLRELLDLIHKEGFTEKSASYIENNNKKTSVWFETSDADINFETGENTFYGLHIETNNRNMIRICKLAGITIQ